MLNFRDHKKENMKKIQFFTAIIVVSFTSCKKDYTCQCTDTLGNVTEITVIHDTKSSAKTTCAARKSSPEVCAIK